MTDSIVGAQQRVSQENNFQFVGPFMANEAGHIANLTNQLKNVLLELRTRCLHFTSNHGVNELRKCPHCGVIWAKVVGCTGTTTCGKLVNSIDVRKKGTGVMATFTFNWDEQREELFITRSGERHARKYEAEGRGSKGCGRSITWSSMALVDVPEDFCATHEVNVQDIASLPGEAASAWNRSFEEEKAKYEIKEGLPYAVQESSAYDMDEFAFDFRA